MSRVPEKQSRSKRQNKDYSAPTLTVYGRVLDLTLGGATSTAEGSNMRLASSDRRLKENITRVGRHSAGFGIYLFDYIDEFKAAFGEGRQFGVMADEVAAVIPEAVSVGPDGYLRVDYGSLGIVNTVGGAS